MSERAAERAIRTAMLLAAPPESVYSELRNLSREDSLFQHESLTDTDQAVLARDNPLINLALAQTTQETAILRDLYGRSRANGISDEQQSKYLYGLRVACLSNPAEPRVSLARAPVAFLDDTELARIVQDGKEEETEALFRNPSITGLLKGLLTRTNQFADLTEDRWCRLLWIVAGNERLNIDNGDQFGPDLDAWHIQKSVATLARIVPVSKHGARALISVLERIHKHISAESLSQHAEILDRWREWNYVPEKEREYGWSEDLKTEVLALLGAIIGSYSTTDQGGKFSLCWIKNFDSADLSERCAYYSIERLSDKQMEAGYQKDNEYFLRSVFVNSSVMWNRAQRNFIEERLPDHLVWRYKHHCRLFKRDRSDFDDTMQSAELRENRQTTEAILTERISALETHILRLEGWIKSTKAWVIWASIIIAGLIILVRH